MIKKILASMEEHVALITGAGMGIGQSTAEVFAELGTHIVLADIDLEAAEETASSLDKYPGKMLPLKVDVSKPDQVEMMIQKTIDEFGKLNYACNNAGIGGESNMVADYSIDGWKKVIDVNLNGVFYCMKYELPYILKEKGAVVNVSSILGKVGFAGASAYTSAKHGVVGLTEAAAAEYSSEGVRVNAVCPAFIKTPMLEQAGITEGTDIYNQLVQMHPIGRFGTPDEIAQTIVWLCSPAAGFITGASILADGGYTAR